MKNMYEKLIVFFFIAISVPLSSSEGKKNKSPLVPKECSLSNADRPKGILKSNVNFHKNKKVNFGKNQTFEYKKEEQKLQSWQTNSEEVKARVEALYKKGNGNLRLGWALEHQRLEASKFRRNLLIKGTKYDDLCQENVNLKCFICASAAIVVGVAVPAAIYYFSMMKNNDEEF